MSEDSTENSEETFLIGKDLEKSAVVEKSQDGSVAGFIYLGFVLNMCINFVLQEAKYFSDVFGPSFGSQAAFTFGVSNLIGQLTMLALPPDLSFGGRISVSCFLMGSSMIAVPLMTYLSMSFTLYLVHVLIVVIGVSNAVLGSALFGITGFCSERIRKFFNMGACLSGIMVWPLMLVVDTILSSVFGMNPVRNDPNHPSSMEMASCLIVLCVGATCFFATIPVYLFGLGRSKSVTDALAKIQERKKENKSKYFGKILLATMPMAVAAWNVMFLTFLALPDQMVQWRPSMDYPFRGANTYQDLVIFTFNLCDFLGRVCAVNWIKLNIVQVLIASLSRWVLLPFFFLAAANLTFFSNDMFKLILQASFAGSYGVVMTWAMTLGPSQPGLSSDDADTAGMIMSIVLVIGLMMGSLTSGFVRDIPTRFLRFEPYRVTCAMDVGMQTLVCTPPQPT